MAKNKSGSAQPAQRTPREKRAEAKQRAKVAAEAARAAKRRKQIRDNVLVIGAGVLVVALVVGWLVWREIDKKNAPVPSAATDSYGLLVGAAEAPAQVVIYEDFLCPMCGSLERGTGEALATAAEAGRLSVEYRPISILNDYSQRATMAFWSVLDSDGPEVAKKFHDALFAEQPAENGDMPANDQLITWAQGAGADSAALRKAMADKTFSDYVDNATDAATGSNIRSTPTVLVNGERLTTTGQALVNQLLVLAGAAGTDDSTP